MEERPSSSSSLAEELLPRPLSRLRMRFSPAPPSPPPTPPPPLLLAPSPPPESPPRTAAPLAAWETEELQGGSTVDGSLPRSSGPGETSLPRLGQLGVQRIGTLPAGTAAASRRVSWCDRRRELFGETPTPTTPTPTPTPPPDKVCSSSSPSPSASPRPSPQNAEGKVWKSPGDPDELALTNLFSRDEEPGSGREEAGGNGGGGGNDIVCDESVSVCSSGGGWKADYSSHFKSGSSSAAAAAVPPLSRIASATAASPPFPAPSPSPSPTSSILPRPLSPKKSTKLVPCVAAAAAAAAESSPKMPAPPNIRSATPTPRSPPRRPQSSARSRKCVTPDVSCDRCSEHRLMQCSCCNRKEKSHLDLQIGVERELVVEENPVQKRNPVTRILTGPPERKPPMRFGLSPAKTEFLNKAAAMNAEAKARFTVLPVVTLSKARRVPLPEPRQEREREREREREDRPRSLSRLNPEFKGGWARECSAVLPRPGSCHGHHGHSHGSHGHSHGSRRSSSVPSPPQLDLATPMLNSTARLLERLEETRNEKFDPRAVLESGSFHHRNHGHRDHNHDHNRDHNHDGHRDHNHGQSLSSEEPSERYKDLCKISGHHSPSNEARMPRKQRRERMSLSELNLKKPEMSDLWVASEQCPQVCSTAPIRIDPPYWKPDEMPKFRTDEESERQALYRGAREAMSLYGFPNLFFKND